MTDEFHGAKAVIFVGGELLVYQRDRGVPWPGYWDFPGGGRESSETPLDCLRRETWEEFGLIISQDTVRWQRALPSMSDPKQAAWFFVIALHVEMKRNIRFGNEGQRWALMSLEGVMNMPNLVPALHGRLSLWLRSGGMDII